MSGRVLLALVVAIATTPESFAQRLPQPASLSETVSWSSGVAYAYDPSGNIVTAGADTYGYDAVGRLVRSTVNGTERRYAYDAHGNMISCVQWPDTPSASPCTLADYGVSAATNRLTAAVDSDSDPTNDTYDAAGNVVRLAGHTYTYDALDMQVSDSSVLGEREYVYDADGERIAIHILPAGTAPPGQPKLGEWRWTFRDASGKVLREFRSADTASGMGGWTWVRDYVWRDGQLLTSLQRDASGTLVTYHYHLDHLGTPRRVTDGTDRIVGIHDYHPFGVELSSSQDEPLGGSMRFTGHERDAFESDWTTTLDYMHARFYSSAAGRFLSVDPGRDWDILQPQSWNMYSYVRNNPINNTDQTGKWVDTFIDVVDLGVGIGQIWSSALQGRPVTLEQNLAIGASVVGMILPGATGLGSAVRHADDVADGAKAINSVRKPGFVVTPHGEAIAIPTGAAGPLPPQRGSGLAYQGGAGGKGMDKRVTGVRVMDANKNQGQHVNYMNKSGQTVDPKTGRTIKDDDPRGHLPVKPFEPGKPNKCVPGVDGCKG